MSMTMFFPPQPDLPPSGYTQPQMPPQGMQPYPPPQHWQYPQGYYPPPMPYQQQARPIREGMKFAAIMTWLAAFGSGVLAGVGGGPAFTGLGVILTIASFVFLCLI